MRKPLVIGQFSFSLLFIEHNQSEVLVSFVKTTESYVKTTESYEVCRLGHHKDRTFTGKDQNGPNNRIGPGCAGRAQLQ